MSEVRSVTVRLSADTRAYLSAMLAASAQTDKTAAAMAASVEASSKKQTAAQARAGKAATAAGNAQAAAARKSSGASAMMAAGLKADALTAEQAWKKIGTASKWAILGAAAGSVWMVKQAVDFQHAMALVQTLGHTNAATTAQLAMAAKTVGQQYGYTAMQVADAEAELTKAGISAKDQMGGALVGALTAAAAGQTDVAHATEIAAAAMTQFQLAGKDVPHIADLLAAGADKALGSIADLGDGLAQVGSTAHLMRWSLEDTVGTLTALAQAGQIGQRGGTQLSMMLLMLARPTKKSQSIMKQYGFNPYDQQGHMKGPAELAQSLRESFGGLTDKDRNFALGEMFGSRAIRAAAALYKEGGKGIDSWIKKVNDSGFASQQARGKLNSLTGDLMKLKSAFQTAFIDTGNGAISPLRVMAQDAEHLVNAFNQLPNGVKAGIGHALIGAAVVGTGLYAARKVAGALSTGAQIVRAVTGVGKSAVATEFGKVLKGGVTPVYVTNWKDAPGGGRGGSGGGGAGGAGGAASEGEKAGVSLGEGAAVSALRGTLSVAGPALLTSGDQGYASAVQAAIQKALDSLPDLSKYHGKKTSSWLYSSQGTHNQDIINGVQAALKVDSVVGIRLLKKFQHDSKLTWDQTVAYFKAKPLLAAARKEMADSAKGWAQLLKIPLNIRDAVHIPKPPPVDKAALRKVENAVGDVFNFGSKNVVSPVVKDVKKVEHALADFLDFGSNTIKKKIPPKINTKLTMESGTFLVQALKAQNAKDTLARPVTVPVSFMSNINAAIASWSSAISGMFGGMGLGTNANGKKGSWSGGYTGDGGKFQPAGLVHKGEYVFSSEATAAAGADNLDRMHRALRGYWAGGLVGSMPGYAAGGKVTAYVAAHPGSELTREFEHLSAAVKKSAAAVSRETSLRDRLTQARDTLISTVESNLGPNPWAQTNAWMQGGGSASVFSTLTQQRKDADSFARLTGKLRREGVHGAALDAAESQGLDAVRSLASMSKRDVRRYQTLFTERDAAIARAKVSAGKTYVVDLAPVTREVARTNRALQAANRRLAAIEREIEKQPKAIGSEINKKAAGR